MARDKLLAEWFWVDRWMSSSGFLLPMLARGIYREMLSQAWLRGAKLPRNPEAIRRAIGCTTREWSKGWPFVEPFWVVDGDWLVNVTQQVVYLQAAGLAQRASARGLRGAQARAQVDAQVVLKHQLEHKPPSPSPSPSVKKHATHVAPAKKPPDPRVREFLTWFQSEYRTRRHGADYLVKWDKHGTLVKQMLGATDLDRLKKYAQILLSEKTDDEFIVSTDRGIEILSSKFSWLSDRLAAWEQTRVARA